MAIATPTKFTYLNFSSTSGSKSFDAGSGSDRVMFVATTNNSGTDGGFAVTFNGASFTQIGTITVAGIGTMRLWYLINPASGSNTWAVSRTNTGDTWCLAIVYEGASQIQQGDTYHTQAHAATSMQNTLTTPADNCWTLEVIGSNRTQTAGSGTAFRVNNTAPFAFFDSNGAVTPAGSNTLTVAQSDTTAAGSIMVAIRPVAAVGNTSNFFQFF
jgi:hypothetical protein